MNNGSGDLTEIRWKCPLAHRYMYLRRLMAHAQPAGTCTCAGLKVLTKSAPDF